MNSLSFVKYHGAGNDFVLVDDRAGAWAPFETRAHIAALCTRHLGVGADGMMLLRESSGTLRMVYYNADGAPSSFCGNGSRCFLAFAHELGLVTPGTCVPFVASDGSHEGELHGDGTVTVSMRLTGGVRCLGDGEDEVDTGSPHLIRWLESLPAGDIVAHAREVRYSPPYEAVGINVNFAARTGPRSLSLRTYERGVEAETLACGTGVTAAALSFAERQTLTGELSIRVAALGGELEVTFARTAAGAFERVSLRGPAQRVFNGVIGTGELARISRARAPS